MKYDVGDILFYRGRNSDDFHALVVEKHKAYEDNGSGGAWPCDTYIIHIFEDNESYHAGAFEIERGAYTKVA